MVKYRVEKSIDMAYRKDPSCGQYILYINDPLCMNAKTNQYFYNYSYINFHKGLEILSHVSIETEKMVWNVFATAKL